jgi:hypothetical protein
MQTILNVATLRLKAERLFKRHYLALLVERRSPSSEAAADSALTKVKERMKRLIDTAPETATLPESDREEVWQSILEVLIEWQMLLISIPIDWSRIVLNAPMNYNPDDDSTESFVICR